MLDLVVNRHALPDWYRCQSVVFVYPYKLKDRQHLMQFYDKLWQFIPDDVGITLVVKNISFSKDYLKQCRDKGIANQIEFIEIPDISDIWIRDFAPLSIMEGGVKTAWQFEYSPDYVDKKYRKYLKNDRIAGEQIWKQIHGFGVNSSYFKWDMGNLTHNGKGTAIVSNRLIADNQAVNVEHELRPMLHVFLGFKNLIFIPIEPLDATGHVDGMVRFIDEKTVVVGAYDYGIDNHNFMDTVAKNLQEDLGSDFTIIRLMNGNPEDLESEGIGSAYGNHMNFLRINDTILFPYYSDGISMLPLENFRYELERNKINISVTPVDMPELLDLVRLGGVLNCISWQNFAYEKPIVKI